MIIQLLRYFKNNIILSPTSTIRVVALLAAVLAYGTTGFLYFELPGNPDLAWTDGLWYTIVTIATVGYGDFFPKTDAGRFLVGWPIMFFGIGLLGYALSLIAATLITAKAKELKGMTSFPLKKHLVIFNFPGVAIIERIMEELSLDPAFDKHFETVLIDEDLVELPIELQKLNIRFVRGNPTRDETLLRASIDQARHAVVLSKTPGNPVSDNLNVSITLAIEGRARKVNTVVECIDPSTEELLRKTGCDRIVCTSRFGAHFLSQELLNPGVQEVIDDILSSKRGQQIYFVPFEGAATTFAELVSTCRKLGHIALGVSSERGTLVNPTGDTPVKAGDRVITIGPGRINKLSI